MSRPVLLVTGGSRGIGAAICRFAAERGYDVAVNYQGNAAAAAEVVAGCERARAKAVALHQSFDAMAAAGRLVHHPRSSVVAIADGRLQIIGEAGARLR